MDITILLGLQTFREGVGSIFTEFLNKVTWFGDMNIVIVLIAIIYWSISKETGTYLLMGWSGNRIVNGFLKVTACVYRPWIRDPRIIPNAEAKELATGYSFPSGHSMNAASLYGGIGMKKGVHKVIRIIMWIMVVLIIFSRNFLGVHTPQDVLVGVVLGLIVMLLTGKLLEWLKKHPKMDLLVAGIGIAIAIAVAIYASVKSYPVDYDAGGKILVDGHKMAQDTFKAVGWASGFFAGWVLERRFVKFEDDVSLQLRAVRATVGLFCYYIVTLIINPLIKSVTPSSAGNVIRCFIQMFCIVFLFPLIFVLIEKRTEKNTAGSAKGNER